MKRAPAILLLLAVSLGLLAEVGVRLAGIGEFALYRSDPVVGYIPAPGQSGRFLNRYRWAFNERSMGVERPFRPQPGHVLLVGDSVVLGGNQVDQRDKVGPSLERSTGCTTWPISAGSWQLANELRMIRANPDLLNLDTIVFVSNSGDFGPASVWTNPIVHPRTRPWSVLLYAYRRYRFYEPDPPIIDARKEWGPLLQAFLRRYRGRLIWVIYPAKRELGARSRTFTPLLQMIGSRATIVDVDSDRRWNGSLYKDGIHPSSDGARQLAKIIGEKVGDCRQRRTP